MDTQITFHNGESPHLIVNLPISMVYEGFIPKPTDDRIIEPDTGTVIAQRYGRGSSRSWHIEVGQHKGTWRTNVTVEPVIHEHVILTALVVRTPKQRENAMRWLSVRLNRASFRGEPDHSHVESWWFAEDDRTDGSDCESAVFVPTEFDLSTKRSRSGLSQHDARLVLESLESMVVGGCTVSEVVAVMENIDLYPESEAVILSCPDRACPVVQFTDRVSAGQWGVCPQCGHEGVS